MVVVLLSPAEGGGGTSPPLLFLVPSLPTLLPAIDPSFRLTTSICAGELVRLS